MSAVCRIRRPIRRVRGTRVSCARAGLRLSLGRRVPKTPDGEPGRPVQVWPNWFLPAGLVPVVGWAATACEVTLAIGLLIGWRLHWVAFVAGILLTAFAVMMAVALGPKSPLAYSVPSAAGAAFLLAALTCTTSPRTGLEFARPASAG